MKNKILTMVGGVILVLAIKPYIALCCTIWVIFGGAQ